MIRIALVDDHEIVRRGLRELLEAEADMSVVAEAGSHAEAMANIDPAEIDVAVLDVRLPDTSGVEICRDLRNVRSDLACLMLTSFADDEALDASVVAGARGYVLKNVSSNDLVSSIRRVAEGESLISEDVLERVRARLRRRAMEMARIESLSPQEHRILELLSEGMTNREIADQMFLAEKTVKNYVSNLLAKLGFQHRTEAALFAQKNLPHPDGHGS
jgi:two-component system, NarL family, response regulator DevR